MKHFLRGHIWKEAGREYLRSEWRNDGPFYRRLFHYYAHKQKCILCGKERVFENRIIFLHSTTTPKD